MKRTRLKRKTKLRKKSNLTISKLKAKAWKLFSIYIRLRDCLATTGTLTKGRCVTCSKVFPFKSLQAGHYLPGRGNAILFDETQTYAQCFRCNICLKSNWVAYDEFMRIKYGHKAIQQMKINSRKPKQFTIYELEVLIKILNEKIKELKK